MKIDWREIHGIFTGSVKTMKFQISVFMAIKSIFMEFSQTFHGIFTEETHSDHCRVKYNINHYLHIIPPDLTSPSTYFSNT